MTTATQTALAFRELHARGVLVLANAWDAGTARLIESLGAKAIATSSAAVAWSHGYPDGDQLPAARLEATVAGIVRAVRVPVSVDVEGGYADKPTMVGELVGRLIEAGVVGINIEDGTGTPDTLCKKLEAIRRAASRLGVELYANARVDVYLHALAPAERRVEETVARANRYRSAGADGIFVPGVSAPAEIQQIASAVPLPLNVLAIPALPSVQELEALGVRRLSAGSSIAQAVFGYTATLARTFLESGASEVRADGIMPYVEINRLMSAH